MMAEVISLSTGNLHLVCCCKYWRSLAFLRSTVSSVTSCRQLYSCVSISGCCPAEHLFWTNTGPDQPHAVQWNVISTTPFFLSDWTLNPCLYCRLTPNSLFNSITLTTYHSHPSSSYPSHPLICIIYSFIFPFSILFSLWHVSSWGLKWKKPIPKLSFPHLSLLASLPISPILTPKFSPRPALSV